MVQHMDMVAPEEANLVHLVEAAERRAPSALQRYIETRLDGGRGPDWLDGQQIDLGARACEMLGLLMTRDVTKKMPVVSSSDLDVVGSVGFVHAAAGEPGIRAALRQVHERARTRELSYGPAQVFGFF